MKITVVCDILGKEDNGTTIATMNFIRHLQKNHEVRILCCDETKKDLPNYFVVGTKQFPGAIGKFVKSTGFQLAKPDKRIVEKAVVGADVIHVFEPFALGIAAIKCAKKHHIPVTAAMHILPEHLTFYVNISKVKAANAFLYKYWWNEVYKKVQAIHYPTTFVRDVFYVHNPKARNIKPYVISNGVDPLVKKTEVEKPSNFKDKIVILCCGRFSPEKSQKTLIEAIKYSKYLEKIQIIFAGQGQREKQYRELSQYMPNRPLFKRFSHKELIEVLNYCDMVVHPAIIETEGICVLEAMTCGKLVIVSDAKIAAPKTFEIDERCIFRAQNAQDLAKNIDFWIEHPNDKDQIQNENLSRGKNFDLEKCMLALEKMLIDTTKK